MDDSGYNSLMILVSIVASVAIGMVWYAPPVFGKTWQKLLGMPENTKPGIAAFAIWIGGYVVVAITMAYLFKHLGANDAFQGARWGLTLGLTLIAPAVAGNFAFAKTSPKAFLIEIGYVVISLAVMGAIIGAGR